MAIEDTEPAPRADDLEAPFAAAGGIAGGIEAHRIRDRIARELFAAPADPLQLGRFRVVDRLGAGGMGIVYRALDPALDRTIALKVLRAETTAPDARERLLREAKAMASVRHPNLVTVHEVGEEGAHVFIAMELVGGGTLRAWMADGDLSWRDVHDRMVEAGQGLAALHAKELVHRDIKPDNVLLDAAGQAMLADFGLARPIRLALEQDVPQTRRRGPLLESLTATGAMVGTPAYMAPEQLEGAAADARTDQFGFCSVFFEALYGRRAFDADSVEALRAALQRGRPAIPDRPRVGRVPRWLQSVVLRGLRVRPEDRYPSMDALLGDLSRRERRPRRVAFAVLGAGLLASTAWFGRTAPDAPSPCERVGDAVDAAYDDARRTRSKDSFTASGIPFAATSWSAVDEQLSRYAEALRAKRREACEASLVRGERSAEAFDVQMRCLDRRLEDLTALAGLMEEGKPTTVRNAVRAAGELAPPAGCDDTDALTALYPAPEDERIRRDWSEARSMVARMKVLATSGYPKKARELAETAADLAREIGHTPLLAETTYFLATSSAELGQHAESIEQFEQAFNLALESDWALYQAWSAITLVRALGVDQRDLDKGRSWAKIAAAAVKRLDDDPRAEAAYHTNVGSLDLAAGDLPSARTHLIAAVAIHEAQDPPLVYGLADALGNLGVLERREGNLDAAVTRYESARQVLQQRLGSEHPQVGAIENNLGAVHFARDDMDAAAAAWKRSLEIKRRTLPEHHPSLGHAHNNLGEVAAREGEHEAAITSFDRALELWTPLGADHPLVGHARLQRGLSLMALDRAEEAEAELRGALVALARGAPQQRVQTRFLLAKLVRRRDPSSNEALRLAEDALDEVPEASSMRTPLEAFIEAG